MISSRRCCLENLLRRRSICLYELPITPRRRHVMFCRAICQRRSKHLNDQELGQLMAAVTAEQERRGKKPPSHAKTPSKGPVEAVAVPLTPGKLSAVRAAFKAGVRPSKIAKQFGVSQSDVRKVLA